MLAPAPYPPPSGLIGWWKGDGNAQDSSGVNNGVIYSAAVSYSQAEVGFSFNFSPGYNIYPAIQIPNGSHQVDVGIGSGFTIEGGIQPNDTVGRPVFDWSPTPSGGGPHLWANFQVAGNLYGNIVDSTGANHILQTPSAILVQSLLQHVALTYDKSSGLGTIYLNGSQAAQTQLGTFTPQTSADLYLGARDVTGGNWNGLLDEMSLYNRALSSSEVWGIYTAFNEGKTCSDCSCASVPLGLVSWWEGDGNCYDHMGTPPGLNPGIPQGSLSYAYAEVGSDAFYLNGSSDVRIPASASLNVGSTGFTIEGWIQAGDSQGRPIIEWDSATTFGVHLWGNFPTIGTLFANIKDTAGLDHTFQSNSDLLGIGLWHHVALTYDNASGQAIIYLDGVIVASQTFNNITPQTTYDLYLGARVIGSPTYWLGALDEMSLYDRALTSSEIGYIYHSLYNGKCGH